MADTDPLAKALAHRLATGPKSNGRHIIFWHDSAGEHEHRVDDLGTQLAVNVIRVAGDEFAVKHRLLVDERTLPFIVYRTGEIPTGIGNWLLDLELAYGVFRADQASLIGEDLGVSDAIARPVVESHPAFFKTADRRERLKKRLNPDDNITLVLAKMSAVLLKTEQHSLSELTRQLLVDEAVGERSGWNLLVEHGLTAFYWDGIRDTYGYAVANPTLEDFTLWVFRSAHEGFTTDTLGRNIDIDYSRWRDSKTSSDALATLAGNAEEALQMSALLEHRQWSEMLESDTFECIDRKIISDLAAGVASKTVTSREIADAVRRRQSTFWFARYEVLYGAIQSASDLLAEIDALDTSMAGFEAGLQRYTSKWFRIDQLYRHFMNAARSTDYPRALEVLTEQVENFYANKFVDPLATAWQEQVDAVETWTSQGITPQRAFFEHYVKPLVDKNKRVIVIISDALRYEIADDLATQLRRYRGEKSKVGFEATLEPTLGVLPSYTQLGMAALLPHSTLGFTGNKALTEVDDQRTDGTAYRSKILKPHGGIAVQAADVKSLPIKELRALTQQQQFMYVYHNDIDATGDKLGTEREVFKAASRTIDELVRLSKQFASAGVGAILITADHGFLFQDRELDQSGYLSTDPQGDEIHDRDRRRVIGRGLKADAAFRHFTAAQLGLSSDYEVLIPKGTRRLKLQGSGSRFVHGGATLQEIVVPVISVSYTDSGKSTVQLVPVSIQQKSPSITTGILRVDVHQTEPVHEKLQGRELRAGIYLGEQLLSNHVTLKFNSESNDPRERYVPARMALSQDADAHNGKDVELRLEEQIPKTTQWRVVEGGKAVYRLKRSFQTDF
ncbi:BREX-1 system phosphatase PglZ type A [Salinibacterium amurskyense]|uniref:BREX-1 system phosphatase PglZ type A n=1 Tax=Salinibacterium amurskyense TaxID=205941 RepID=UPI00311DD6CF